jgi:hypothetical protein
VLCLHTVCGILMLTLFYLTEVALLELQAIPGMLLALVLCFDHRKGKVEYDLDIAFPKGYRYIWFAAVGYGVGLVAALAAGVLTRAPQPALLYLVRSNMLFDSSCKVLACPLWSNIVQILKRSCFLFLNISVFLRFLFTIFGRHHDFVACYRFHPHWGR